MPCAAPSCAEPVREQPIRTRRSWIFNNVERCALWARTRRAEQMHHFGAVDELELGQGQDSVAVERRLEREVEALEGLDRG